MWISHCKKIRKLTFRALALRRKADARTNVSPSLRWKRSDEGLTLETSTSESLSVMVQWVCLGGVEWIFLLILSPFRVRFWGSLRQEHLRRKTSIFSMISIIQWLTNPLWILLRCEHVLIHFTLDTIITILNGRLASKLVTQIRVKFSLPQEHLWRKTSVFQGFQ